MKNHQKSIIIWLLIGCSLIFAMVVIGGITRLTGSGLSITEWNVIMGTFPPLNQDDWQIVFEKYQQSPQFQKVNYDMGINEFQSIFWWEYLHRLIGRLIGIVFLIPFFYFLFKKSLSPSLIKNLIFIFLLGGLQGFLGWYMVQSGLIDIPQVSHYRLAIHLITAFLTYGFTFWVALDLIYSKEKTTAKEQHYNLKKLSVTILLLVVLQIIYGAFVAGLHAGKIYNTFPKMGNDWIADAVTSMSPFWKNLSENMAGVQFIHRYIPLLLLFLIMVLWFIRKKNNLNSLQQKGITFLSISFVLQFLLGVFTLFFAAPIVLSVLHQIGAFILFSSAIFLMFQVKKNNNLKSV